MAAPSLHSLGNARLSLLAKPRTLSTREEFAADIRREWSNALEATVAIGRRLNEARATLPHGDYEAMVANDLPFSPATARKLRECAELVDSGKVPLDRLPEAYSTVYAIATLPDEVRQDALDAGVIRPDMTRAEVEGLRAARRPAVGKGDTPARPAGAAEVEAVAADDLPASVALPPPPVAIREPAVRSSLEAALDLPWFVHPQDTASVMVRIDGEDLVVMAALTDRPAAATIAGYVVNLHNARLMAGKGR